MTVSLNNTIIAINGNEWMKTYYMPRNVHISLSSHCEVGSIIILHKNRLKLKDIRDFTKIIQLTNDKAWTKIYM